MNDPKSGNTPELTRAQTQKRDTSDPRDVPIVVRQAWERLRDQAIQNNDLKLAARLDKQLKELRPDSST